jgi:hypothetical protein
MEYIIIGILAFILGISVTQLCLHIKKTKQSEK